MTFFFLIIILSQILGVILIICDEFSLIDDLKEKYSLRFEKMKL